MQRTSNNTLAGLVLAALVGIGLAANGVQAALEDTGERGRVWKDGAAVYAGICVYCHEQKLREAGVDPAKIRFTVRHGKRAMPAFRSTEIDDAALEQLVEYLSKKEPASK